MYSYSVSSTEAGCHFQGRIRIFMCYFCLLSDHDTTDTYTEKLLPLIKTLVNFLKAKLQSLLLIFKNQSYLGRA